MSLSHENFFYLIIVRKNKTSQNVPNPASTVVTKLFSICIFAPVQAVKVKSSFGTDDGSLNF
jgi:hypothetical protein